MRTVVILEKNEDKRAFTTMTALCRSNPNIFNYNYLKGKNDFPYNYKGYRLTKVELE